MRKFEIFLFVQVQIIFIVVIYLLFKAPQDAQIPSSKEDAESVEVLKNIQLDLIEPIDHEIILGDASALRILFFSRVDCKYCDEFFKTTYQQLKQELDAGEVSFAVRYLTHPSKPRSFYITRCAHLAYQEGFYDEFIDFSGSVYPELDTLKFRGFMLQSGVEEEAFEDFMANEAKSARVAETADIARNAGVISTPTFFVGKTKVVGFRDYQRLSRIIVRELSANSSAEGAN